MTGRCVAIGLLLASTAVGVSGKPVPKQSAQAPTAPYRVACPAVLPPDHVPTRSPDDGWASSAPQRWPADGSGMLHGAHDGQGYLIPGSSEQTKVGGRKVHIRRWSFDIPHWHETWLYCAYGPVELAQRIPAGAVECSASAEFDRGRWGPAVFECK